MLLRSAYTLTWIKRMVKLCCKVQKFPARTS
jgi:hypothetical protein